MISRLRHPLLFGLFAVYLLVVLRDAWVGDDIFITLRTVKQWVLRGELGWNPHERVQAYTHPLWMFCLTLGYALTKEAYFTTLAISVLVSSAAIWVVLARSRNVAGSLLFLAMLINSRAFVDYSTSGLENPLTHLICALTFAVYMSRSVGALPTRRWPAHGRRLFTMSALTALAMVNRLDTVLLVAPMAAWTAIESYRAGLRPRSALVSISLGAIPIVAWELFSLVYYGSFVPNTALAKLNTLIPGHELFIQGLNYLYESLTSDHLTLVVILAGLSLPLATGKRRDIPVLLGALFYTLYLLKIGGDFMSGRFLTGPLFLSAAMLTQLRALDSKQAMGMAAVATLLNLSSPRTTIPLGRPQTPPGRIDHRGIADERGFYMGGAGLNHMNRHNDAPHRGSRYDGESMDPKDIHVRGALGYVGFHADLDTYIVDHWALTDPLVSRLPAIYHPQWRIGHFSRALPGGYIETLKEGKDRFHSRQIAAFYQHLKRIIKGPLWSKERWTSIWLMQTGQLDHFISKPFFRYHGALVANASTLEESPRKGPKAHEFGTSGIFMNFHKTVHDPFITLDLDADDDYLLLYETKGKIIGQKALPRIVPRTTTPIERVVHVDEEIAKIGYQALRVVPVRGHVPYKIWHMHTATDRAQLDQKSAALNAKAQTDAALAPKATVEE